MATYIALNYNTFFEEQNASQSDFSSITSPNSISYSLILTSSTPWTIGGGRYMVYQVAALSDGYTIDSTWFIHSYGGSIGSINDLPLNSKIVYATSNTGTFSGNGFSSGTLYYSSNSFDNPKQSNTWSQATNPGGVAGTSYTYYNRQTSTVSGGKCTNSNFCPTSSYGVSIVELYHSTNGVSNATGLYTSIIDRSAAQSTWPTGTYKSWIYDYKRTSNTGSSYPARINGTGRNVFAIHNTTNSDCDLAIAYGGSTSTTLSDTNYTIGAFGYTKVAYNTWAHHTTEGKHYYSITVNAHSKFIETTLQLEAGSAYTIKMHTYSEANYDGIVISTKKLTSASLSSSSTDGITRCSGVDKKVTYTLASSTSTRTLYIYFKTDSSTLKGPGDVDSTGASINNSTIPNYSTGDVEIYKDNVYVVTFNANGGNFGTVSTKTTNVIVGTSLDLNTVEKPIRGGWKFYGWSVANTDFNFVPNNIYTPKKNVTIYAIWDNFPKFTELSDKSVYCTDDCIAASSTQGSKSIKLFTSGMTCSTGDVTCYTSRSKVYPVGSPDSPISGATFLLTGVNNVTVPSGTPAGDYIASIVVYTSASVSTPGSYYGPTSDTPVTYNIPFTIKATKLTYGPVQYMTYTPDGELTNGDITQQKKFPAGQFTISPDSIGEYFRIYGVFKQEVSCNNGTKREGNVTVNGWVPTPGFKDIVVSSLGTTISDAYTYTFASSNGNALVFNAAGEGNKLFQKFILSGVREANALTNTNYAPYNYTASVAIGDGLTAGGGEAAVTASASHMAYDYYTSGSYDNPHGVSDTAKWMITSNGNSRFSHPSSGGTSLSGVGTVYDSGASVSHSNMTNNETTDTVTVTAYNINKTSATASAEKSITNSLSTTKYKDTSGTTGYNIVYDKPNVGFTSISLTAAGGSATVICVVTNGTNWYQKYTSGTYTGQQTGTEAGTARWMITSNGNSRFSHPSSGGTSLSGVGTVYDSGASISHGNMTTNVTTDTVTVTAYNVDDISKTKEASASITNRKESTNYAPYNYTASVAIGDGLTAGGGEAAVTASASHMAYDYYTSGSYNNPHSVTDGVSWTITSQYINSSGNPIDRFSKSGNTLSHATMGATTGTDYVKVTAVNGSSSSTTASAEKSITNEVVNSDYNASNSNYNVSVNIGSGLNAGKSNAAVSVSGSHTHTYYYLYTSGSTSGPYTSNPSDSPTWSITSQYINSSGNGIERFTQSGNTLSHATMGSTTGTDYVIITATNNSATKTATTNVTNEVVNSDYNASNSNYNVSVNIGSGLNAGKSNAAVSVSGSHTHTYYYLYTSGSTSGPYTSNPSDSPTWSITSQYINSSGNGIERFTQSGNTLSHATMGSTTGTDYVIITATNNSATKTAEKSVTNRKESTNYAPYNYTASVSIGSGLTAGGGEAAVTASASHMAYDYYTSGSYDNPHSVSDTAKWMITSNGNSRFSHPSSGGTSLSGVGTVYDSGASVSHSSMGTTATTDTVTVTAYNVGDTSKTNAASASVSNELTSISLSLGSSSIKYNSTTTATVTATYTSGSSKDVTSSLSTSSSATSNYIKSGDTSIVTIS